MPDPRSDPGDGVRIAHAVRETGQRLGIPVSRDPDVLGQIGPLRDVPTLPAPAFDAVAAVLGFLVSVETEGVGEDGGTGP